MGKPTGILEAKDKKDKVETDRINTIHWVVTSTRAHSASLAAALLTAIVHIL